MLGTDIAADAARCRIERVDIFRRNGKSNFRGTRETGAKYNLGAPPFTSGLRKFVNDSIPHDPSFTAVVRQVPGRCEEILFRGSLKHLGMIAKYV